MRFACSCSFAEPGILAQWTAAVPSEEVGQSLVVPGADGLVPADVARLRCGHQKELADRLLSLVSEPDPLVEALVGGRFHR